MGSASVDERNKTFITGNFLHILFRKKKNDCNQTLCSPFLYGCFDCKTTTKKRNCKTVNFHQGTATHLTIVLIIIIINNNYYWVAYSSERFIKIGLFGSKSGTSINAHPFRSSDRKKGSLVFSVIWEDKATVKVIKAITENIIMYLAYIVFLMFWPSWNANQNN